MILVTGAGGKTGRALIKALSTVEPVRAFARRGQQVSALKAIGGDQVLTGDLRDEAAIRGGMRDVRAVYHICPNMNPGEEEIGKLVIDVAREIGVERFVYHSVLHPQTEKMPHHREKLRVEELLFESGLPFTILQPAPYMQNLLAGWKYIEDGVLRVPYSVSASFSFVDLQDVAAAAAIVLTEPDHLHASYEIVGTSPLTHVEVAGILGRVINRPVRAEQETIADWRAHTSGLSGYATESLIKMFEYYDQYGLTGNPNVLRWLLRREPTSLEMFIRRTVRERDVIH